MCYIQLLLVNGVLGPSGVDAPEDVVQRNKPEQELAPQALAWAILIPCGGVAILVQDVQVIAAQFKCFQISA